MREWKPYSLRERLVMIEQIYGTRISFNTLQAFYKARLVTYKSCKAVYRTYLQRKPQLDAARQQFAGLLGNLIERKAPLVYQDETTCNSFFVKPKSWSRQYERNEHHRDNKRFSVTVFGALSDALQGNFCYMLGNTTNAANYQKFLREVKGKIRADVGHAKAVMFYDGHPAHSCKASLKLCEQLFIPLQNVAHSSDLNSIVSSPFRAPDPFL